MKFLNVLLVDNMPQNLPALQALIHDDDEIKIHLAASQNEALKIIWQEEIALALVELQTADLQGEEFIQVVQNSRKARHTKVIFVTALNSDYKKLAGKFPASAVDFLFKPFDSANAQQKIKMLLDNCRKQAETETKNTLLKAAAETIANSANIICTLCDTSFYITAVNPAVERILGKAPQACLGKPFYELAEFGENSITYSKLNEILSAGNEAFTFEDIFLNQAGERVSLECNAIYNNGQIYLNLHDTTRKRTETDNILALKEQAEELRRTKETMFANVIHEIRTPVTGIIEILQLLTDTKLDARQKELLHIASLNSEALLSLVNDVLDISKIEAGKFSIRQTEVNLHSLVRGVISLLSIRAEKKKLKLFSEHDADTPEFIFADGLRLNQILMNLLSNAIKFTSSGYVQLSLRVLRRNENRVQLEFNVTDTGIGIAQEKLPSIFESFSQADEDTTEKFGGTGLGLAIVKQLADLMGGELTVKSAVSQGTTFTFVNWYEVITPAKKPAEANHKIVQFKPFHNPKVLLVEDNELNQMAIDILVKKWSVKLDHAINGKEAIEMLKNNDYKLILMDTQMPEMNGYEAASAIRNGAVPGKDDIPIISVSANISEDEQKQAINAGMNEVIEKPVKAAELYDKMKTFLEG